MGEMFFGVYHQCNVGGLPVGPARGRGAVVLTLAVAIVYAHNLFFYSLLYDVRFSEKFSPFSISLWKDVALTRARGGWPSYQLRGVTDEPFRLLPRLVCPQRLPPLSPAAAATPLICGGAEGGLTASQNPENTFLKGADAFLLAQILREWGR